MAQIKGRTVNGGEVEFYDAATGTVIMKLQPQAAAIADAGATYDASEQTTINSILAVLRDLGLIAT